MRQVAILVVVIGMAVLPGLAAAQTTPSDAPAPTGRFLLQPAQMNALLGENPSASEQAATARAQAPARRRRGSMVGYIEDPVVSSKARVRFESGFHNVTPDRAEFFYAKCGCYADLGHSDPAFDSEAPGPSPGAANDVNFNQLYLYGEYALNAMVSVFGELPTRWLLPQSFIPGTGGSFPNQTGLGDIRAGMRVALTATDSRMVTLQVKAFLPTGDSSRGLGTDHASLEPAVLLFQQAAPRVLIEAQGGLWVPLGGAVGLPGSESEKFSGQVFFWGVGPSIDAVQTRRVRIAPVLELVSWHVLSGSATGVGDTSGANIFNLKVGARIEWEPRGSVYVGYGHALTDATWYDDVLRFEYRVDF